MIFWLGLIIGFVVGFLSACSSFTSNLKSGYINVNKKCYKVTVIEKGE